MKISRRRMILALLFAVPSITLLTLAALLVRYGTQDRAQKADAILIFGARVGKSGKASPILRARTRHAFELWERKMAPKIVCTGGIGEYAPAEALVSKQLLEKWGVPASAILIDDQSTSTFENARNAAGLLTRGARVIAVSEGFHLWRCQRNCAKFSLLASTSPDVPGWNALPAQSRCFYAVREAILVTRDVFFGGI